MTSQFLRFYLCVVATLAVAWGIQAYNQSQTKDENFQVVQDVYAGQIRLVNEVVSRSENRYLTVESLKPLYAFDMRYVAPQYIEDDLQNEFNFYKKTDGTEEENGIRVIAELPTKDGYVDFGPLPELIAPSRSAQLIGWAFVLFLAALAIALLLRPLVHQLRLVEKTAMAIADGSLHARIDESKSGSAKKMARSFNLMAEKTEKLLATHRQLLQCVSHELRTPISKLRFGVDLIRAANSDQEKSERTRDMELAIDELYILVDELLGYVKLDTMETRLSIEECNLKDIVQRQFENFKPLFPQIEFTLDDHVELGDVTVQADRVMLERVVANLVGNAARFAQSRVRFSTIEQEEHLTIAIDDDGHGILERDREKVFEPFVGADEKKTGTGLGLTIVRKILENHDSKILLQESEWGGCRATISWSGKWASSLQEA